MAVFTLLKSKADPRDHFEDIAGSTWQFELQLAVKFFQITISKTTELHS
jgi:hypothetical protein